MAAAAAGGAVAGAAAGTAGSSPVLFEDFFTVTKLNPEGKKFERVDRLLARGETYGTDLALDIACDVFPLRAGDKFTMAIVWTLDKTGKPMPAYYEPDGKPNLLDDYHYGMSGKVFKYEFVEDRKVAVVASYGGLLMMLTGAQKHLVHIRLDQPIFCLIRKI